MKNLFLTFVFLLSAVTSFAQVPIEFVNNTSDDVYLGILRVYTPNDPLTISCDTCGAEFTTDINNFYGMLAPLSSLTIDDFSNSSAGFDFFTWVGGPFFPLPTTPICIGCTGTQAEGFCGNPVFTSIDFRSGPNGELFGTLHDNTCMPTNNFFETTGLYTATWTVMPNQILVVFDGP